MTRLLCEDEHKWEWDSLDNPNFASYSLNPIHVKRLFLRGIFLFNIELCHWQSYPWIYLLTNFVQFITTTPLIHPRVVYSTDSTGEKDG